MKQTAFSLAALTLAAIAAIAGGTAADAKPAGNPSKGRQIFVRCQACHKIDATGRSGMGPNLAHVMGRKAGTLTGFRYSPAMAKSGLVWNDAELTAFLAAPSRKVPGNRMPFPGLGNPGDRDDVIAYIRSAPR
ncbi:MULTISPECIES: cytochrome c family protein [unclassified Novosphingobium]|uniref:c-type cytochrome n=1 Tax=unclassified Novosphingobium TaxID=2644732 RepID=UPI001358A0D9|nr:MULTISPECIES: cytochrome c family protein [unclassified Novosphingobium]